MILVLRYVPEHQRSRDLLEAIPRRLVPGTLDLIGHAGYQDVKEIVPRDVVTI